MSLFYLSEQKKIKQGFMLAFFESFIQRQRYFPAVQIFFSLPLVLNPMSPSRSWPSWSQNTWRLSAHWPWWGTASAQVSCSPRRLVFLYLETLVSHRSPGNVRLLPDCYVADELVVSRAGRRVRVGNTDAEGRMVMADLLCEMKEKVRKLEETPSASFIIRTPPSLDSDHVTVRVYRRCRKFLQSSSPLPLWLVMPSEPWDPTTQWVLLDH